MAQDEHLDTQQQAGEFAPVPGPEVSAPAATVTAPKEAPPPVGRRLGQLIVAEGWISQEQLTGALVEQRRTGERLGAALVRLGLITEDQHVQMLSRLYRVAPLSLDGSTISADVLKLVPPRIARKYEVIPVERTNGSLTLAVSDPTNLPALDDVAFMTGLRVVPALASPSAIRQAIVHCYKSADDVVTEAEAEIEVLDGRESVGPVDVMELRASADQAPVVRVVNAFLLEALRRGSSDIHLESSETAFRIRFRIDGVLHEVKSLPKRLEPAIVSRIKIMANLDIAERRLPQDGRIKLRSGAREVDFRVNVLPMMFGESVVMRILDKDALNLDLTKLGLDPQALEQLQAATRSSNGVILITGPTGSGKTTTLYSAVHSLNSPDVAIMTVEDPVEYNLAGINQVPVNEAIGRTFATVLRSFLRHDPDVILVGEIRDMETAQIAIRAALTGHLVLSTIHTNDCPSTVARLLDMGIAPYLVAPALRLVVAQRLVRKACPACREPYEVDEDALIPYGHVPEGRGRCTLYRGRGCNACSFTGMRGRVGLYEIMRVTPEIRGLILANAPTDDIREVARQQGMKTLREMGLRKVLEGMTTPDEVLRVTAE